MKKFLLSMAAVAMTASLASAETVTFDFVNETYGLERLSGSTSEYIADGTTIENEGVILTFTSALGDASKNGAGSRLWSDGLRCYNGAEVTVSLASGTIDEITFEAKTPSSFSLEGNTIKYTPTSKNVAITSITVEYSTGGSTVTLPAGLEFEQNAYTVELGETFTAPTLVNPNNLPVTWTSSNEAVATVAADGAVTIVGAGTTTITAESAATEEYRAGKASYTLTVVKSTKANSIADMLALGNENKNNEIIVTFPMTVTYKNGVNTYVTDGKDFTLLYGNTIGEYEALDVIPAGWTAKYSPYNNLPEFVATTTMPASTEKGTFTPRSVTLADISVDNVNEIVMINNVTFEEATPDTRANFNGTDGNVSVVFRNNFLLASVESDTYNVLAVPAVYNTTLQVYPIEYNVATGIAAIEADGVATYFDLQGRAVKGAPAAGLYIKVLNGKATKVVVK